MTQAIPEEHAVVVARATPKQWHFTDFATFNAALTFANGSLRRTRDDS